MERLKAAKNVCDTYHNDETMRHSRTGRTPFASSHSLEHINWFDSPSVMILAINVKHLFPFNGQKATQNALGKARAWS